MPINTDLNIAPYFDDFDLEKQFYKILFKPAYAVQARELTQLQSILQNQLEQFGDNIYQEGSIIKGCNFTTLNGLKYVKLVDGTDQNFDPSQYVSRSEVQIINNVDTQVDVVYRVTGGSTGLTAEILEAARGFQSAAPNMNTWFINYLTTNSGIKQFQPGETLTISKYTYNGAVLYNTESNIATIQVTNLSPATGDSYGIRASSGVIFQKGHFLYAEDQTLVVAKYTNVPDDLSVGYEVTEELVSALSDNSLYDNALGSNNYNAPGADRLKLIPKLVVKDTAEADIDPKFFTLIRYQNGSVVSLRDVSQFNSIAEEMAKRTYEESGNYIVDKFKVDLDRRDGALTALVGKGTAYVKGFRVENSGTVDFNIENIQETDAHNNQSITMDYGNYLDIDSFNGNISLDNAEAELQDGALNTLGYCFVRNITPTKIYLFGLRLVPGADMANVTRIVQNSGWIGVVAGSRLKDSKKAPSIFRTGTNYVKSTSDTIIPTRQWGDFPVASNTITVPAGTNGNIGIDQSDLLVIDSSNTRINILSWSANPANDELTINLDPADTPAANATVYYNEKFTGSTPGIGAEPYSKNMIMPYIKFTFSSTKTRYSLGFPDVFSVEDIYDPATGTRYTESFALKSNQRDQYYDISYIQQIPGRPVPDNGTVLAVKMKVFKVSAGGYYYFTINSYTINDDADTYNEAAGEIRSSDLTIYEGSNGVSYNLRECFDFRPHCDKDPLADYTKTSANLAPLVDTDVGTITPSFSGGPYVFPVPGGVITSDIEFYLSRIDLIAMDSYGRLSLVKGNESYEPVAPRVNADVFVVSEITIPGHPALSPKEAAEQGKLAYAVRTKARGTKNYTMRDIEKLEQRIEGMEYYISLNQLEQQAENLLILDQNGLTRFKNGYIVDPFNDPKIANINDPEYNAAIHFDKSILTPALSTFPLDLKYKTGTQVSIFPSINNPEVASLSRSSNVKLMGQPYATNYRNCVSNFYKYDGIAQLSPDHDMLPDTITDPVPVELDLYSLFNDLNSKLPITGVNWDNAVARDGSTWMAGRQTITERFEEARIDQLVVNDGGTNAVGDFVTNLNFQPYMRSRLVNVYMSGLRPDTQHYFFFDGINVDAHVAPGTVTLEARDIQKAGEKGDPVSTDSKGVLRAIFEIPESTFFVGDRVMQVADVSQYSSIESASTSRANATYHAYNINVTKTTIATRVPAFDVTDGGTTTRTLPSRVITRHDPLAQTFFIKSGMGRGSDSVFASKVDLYFKRKSDVNGVTVTLREVLNGYPTGIILPFSQVHLTSSQVNVSDDATAVTEVFFDAPVRMDVEKEYAVVIMPDANDPNYLHFTSKVGGLDLTAGPTQGQAVVQDWGDGVLFTSTNNRAWKSYQDEDIKFSLYRHEFDSATGSVTLTNDDHEFFTLADWDGRFQQNEPVYTTVANTSFAVSMVQGEYVINMDGAGDFTSLYLANDYIHIENTAGKADLFRVVSVDSSTEMTLDKPCWFDGTLSSIGTAVIKGELSYLNRITFDTIHLKQSSARPSRVFQTGNIITGMLSGRTAEIGTVDNIEISYVQPFIQKSNDSVSTTALSGTFNDPADPLVNYNLNMQFGNNLLFNKNGVVIWSKSNDPLRLKPFDIKVNLGNNANPTSTPIVDLQLSSLIGYKFNVTNVSDTTSKYISKTVELAEDLDAEDMQLTLTAYRPTGTDIKIYIKPQSALDSSDFDQQGWIELELFEGTNTYCSSINTNDYREFKWRVAEADKDVNDVLQYTGPNGTFSGYRKFAIKIELLAENIWNAPFVKDYRGIALT